MLESLYADDPVIITESLEELQEKLILWKTNMERKGLWVNMGKTKVLISGPGSLCFKSPVPFVSDVSTNAVFSGGRSLLVLP